MGKGGGTDKVKQTSEPWGPAQPHLEEVLRRAEELYNQGAGTGYYPGQTYIDPSRDTLAAQAAIRNRALSGSPMLGAAEQNLTSTLQGDYLSAGNPYFEQMAGRVTNQVLPNIQGMFGGAGRAGSAGNAEAVARGLGDSIGALAYQNFNDERQRQMQGLTLAPGIEQAGYMPAQQLGLLGQQIEGYEGQRLQDDMARFNFQEQAPWDLLGRYAGLASGMGAQGGTSTQTQPRQGPGGLQTALGIGSLIAAPFTGGLSLGGLFGGGAPLALGVGGGASLGAGAFYPAAGLGGGLGMTGIW